MASVEIDGPGAGMLLGATRDGNDPCKGMKCTCEQRYFPFPVRDFTVFDLNKINKAKPEFGQFMQLCTLATEVGTMSGSKLLACEGDLLPALQKKQGTASKENCSV